MRRDLHLKLRMLMCEMSDHELMDAADLIWEHLAHKYPMMRRAFAAIEKDESVRRRFAAEMRDEERKQAQGDAG